MSFFVPSNSFRRRGRLLAGVAALALAGQVALAPPAGAAAVMTSDLRADALPSFATVVERVKPAVVSVKVELGAATAGDDGAGLGALPPQIQEFLRRFGMPPAAERAPQGPGPRGMAQGSGFFVSADGLVVTNNHVVENASSVTVTTDAGEVLTAKVIGTDSKTDLALLRVEPKSGRADFPFVALSKEAPRQGEWVVAIGNPYGLGGTVTAGIVSATGRDIGAGPYDDFLQIDAPINRGNSGGPTFNLKGEVIGVNTAIFSPSGGNIGLAFAIPANTVAAVVDALAHDGQVARGFMGVQIQKVTADLAEGLGLKQAQGALVAAAEPGSPAAKAGLRAGDVVVALNGHRIADARDLSRQVGTLKPGETVTLRTLRDGRERTVEVTLGSQAPQRTARAEAAPQERATPDDGTLAALGVRLAPASRVRGAGNDGVVVVELDPDGAAASRGLADGDVILEVGGRKVRAPEDVRRGLDEARHDGKRMVLLKVRGEQGAHFVALPVPRA